MKEHDLLTQARKHLLIQEDALTAYRTGKKISKRLENALSEAREFNFLLKFKKEIEL